MSLAAHGGTDTSQLGGIGYVREHCRTDCNIIALLMYAADLQTLLDSAVRSPAMTVNMTRCIRRDLPPSLTVRESSSSLAAEASTFGGPASRRRDKQTLSRV